jgi:hypothetical protein
MIHKQHVHKMLEREDEQDEEDSKKAKKNLNKGGNE